MAAVGEIRQNPGGRRLLLLGVLYPDGAVERPRGELWTTLQLNGKWAGEKFGVPAADLDSWHLIGTLPPDDYAAKP